MIYNLFYQNISLFIYVGNIINFIKNFEIQINELIKDRDKTFWFQK